MTKKNPPKRPLAPPRAHALDLGKPRTLEDIAAAFGATSPLAGVAPPVTDGAGYDAHLDPWCIVDLTTGETVLFGFALVHPVTNGLSWLHSSHVISLKMADLTATTRSGRRYVLGRYFNVTDISGEGEEARTAFDVMLGAEAKAMQSIRLLDAQWVAACKMARHLALPPPTRRQADIEAFTKSNQQDYVRLCNRHGLS